METIYPTQNTDIPKTLNEGIPNNDNGDSISMKSVSHLETYCLL